MLSLHIKAWANGIKRLSSYLRFSPAQSQSSSISQTIKATCSFLQMTYYLRSDFGIFFGIRKLKSGSQLPVSHFCAEREGFEPPDPLRSTVFKTAAFDHSAISPICFPRKGMQRYEYFRNLQIFLRLFSQKDIYAIRKESLTVPLRRTCTGTEAGRLLRR